MIQFYTNQQWGAGKFNAFTGGIIFSSTLIVYILDHILTARHGFPNLHESDWECDFSLVRLN